MKYYKNKKVLVTGASSGIGIAFCHQLASYGAELVITARRKERLDALSEELKFRYACRVTVIPCDLADPAGVTELLDNLQKLNLEIDILINNAGFGFNGSFTEGDPQLYQQMMQVNMNSLVMLTRGLLPGMIQRNSGGVLNISSMAGFLPIPYFAVYSATKQFVINFTWSLWRELKRTRIHTAVLCPGPVNTEFMEVAGVDRRKAAFRGMQTAETVADKGLKGLRKNRGLKFSKPLLRIPYILSKLMPIKLALAAGEIAMKK